MTTKRSVQFNDEFLCEYHTGAVMDYIDEVLASDIWYQHTELQQLKRNAMVISKETNRYGLGSILSNTYGRTDSETQQAMNTWARNSSSRRGLERFINNEYSSKRSDIRRRTIKSVIRAQRKMKEEGVADADYSMKVLFRLSEAFSQDSRNFARMMGIADEVAVDDRGVVVASEAGTVKSLSSSCCDSDEDTEQALKSIENHEQMLLRGGSQCPSEGSSHGHVRPFSSVTTITTPSTNVMKLPPRRNLGLSAASSNNTRSVNDLRHYC